MLYNFFPEQQNIELMFRLVLACVCGILIGLERTRQQKSAGVKTYMIVAMGAALFTIGSKYGFLDALGDGRRADVARVSCNIVTGVSFLGAGTIFMRGDRVRGLTTAAGIWVMAAIGMAAGCGLYVVAAMATAVILGVQILARSKMFAILDVKVPGKIEVCMDDSFESLRQLERILRECRIEIVSSYIKRHKDGDMHYTLSVRMPEKTAVADVVSRISQIKKVKSIDM